MESGGGVYQSTPASKVPSLWEHRERLSPRVQDVPKNDRVCLWKSETSVAVQQRQHQHQRCQKEVNCCPCSLAQTGARRLWGGEKQGEVWWWWWPMLKFTLSRQRQAELDDKAVGKKTPKTVTRKKKKKSYSSCGATILRLHRCITAVTQTIRELCLCRKLTHLSCPRRPALWNCLYFRWRNNLSPV